MFIKDADIINKAPRDITRLTMGDIEIDRSQTLVAFLDVISFRVDNGYLIMEAPV